LNPACDGDGWERFKSEEGRERKVYRKNGHWGLVGYIPTIVVMMGCFLGVEKKRGFGIRELMELIFCPSISNMTFFWLLGMRLGNFWRCSYSMHQIVEVEEQSSN
jgi:hypothetical protein